MIHFTDGTTMTYAEAAAKMRDAEELYVSKECALHHLVGSDFLGIVNYHLFRDKTQYTTIYRVNDCFEGTPEERAQFMAQWFDALHLDDPECSTPIQDIITQTVEAPNGATVVLPGPLILSPDDPVVIEVT